MLCGSIETVNVVFSRSEVSIENFGGKIVKVRRSWYRKRRGDWKVYKGNEEWCVLTAIVWVAREQSICEDNGSVLGYC